MLRPPVSSDAAVVAEEAAAAELLEEEEKELAAARSKKEAKAQKQRRRKAVQEAERKRREQEEEAARAAEVKRKEEEARAAEVKRKEEARAAEVKRKAAEEAKRRHANDTTQNACPADSQSRQPRPFLHLLLQPRKTKDSSLSPRLRRHGGEESEERGEGGGEGSTAQVPGTSCSGEAGVDAAENGGGDGSRASKQAEQTFLSRFNLSPSPAAVSEVSEAEESWPVTAAASGAESVRVSEAAAGAPRAGAEALDSAAAALAEAQECVVCMEQEKSYVLVPCGHAVVCKSCAEDIVAMSRECPVCRRSVEQVIKLFHC